MKKKYQHQYRFSFYLAILLVLVACGKINLSLTKLVNTPVFNYIGNGTFGANTDYLAQGSTLDLATADFNGDEKWDIVVTNHNRNTVTVFIGVGDGTFYAGTSYAAGNRPWGVAIGDLNADGYPDIVTANLTSSNFSVLLNNRNGTFAAATNTALGFSGRDVVLADLNSDDRLDVVFNNMGGDKIVSRLGNGNGTFGAAIETDTINTGGGVYALQVDDFNNDGRMDVAAADSMGLTVRVQMGNGNGTFAAGTDYVINVGDTTQIEFITSSDLNGDGMKDLLVGSDRGLGVLINAGTGAFNARALYTAGSYLGGIAIGDFNGDTIPDAAVSNFNDNTISLFSGNGNGTFAAQTVLNTGAGPWGLITKDFNGDDKLDLALCSFSINSMSVHLGN